jgi:hypothetical protein
LFLTPPADQRAHVLFALVILFICGMHSITFGHSRYHLPLMPVLMIYAAAALRGRHEIFERLPTRAVLASTLVGVGAISIWGHEVFVRDFDRIAVLLRGWGYSA